MFESLIMIAALAMGAGLFFGLIVIIASFVYCLPYTVWAAWFGKLPERERAGVGFIRHEVCNATRLYFSWITGKPHGIVDVSKPPSN